MAIKIISSEDLKRVEKETNEFEATNNVFACQSHVTALPYGEGQCGIRYTTVLFFGK